MVWHAFRCLRLEQEKACDDFVLNAGQRSSSYGRHLMEIAMNARSFNSTASLPVVQSSSLVARIRALVDEQSDRRPVQRHQLLRVGVLIGCVSCLIATLSLADGTRYAETSLRPAAEQAEAMTVADDGSVRFTLNRFEVSLRPMTAEELNCQFPARGSFRHSTVFRLGVKNYYYPKVFIDPASIVMRSPDGRKWYNLAPAHFATAPSSGRDRNKLLREALFTADAVFAGQEKSGYVLFTGLDPDVRDIQVTVTDAVLRYDYRGEPVQTVDFTYRFER